MNRLVAHGNRAPHRSHQKNRVAIDHRKRIHENIFCTTIPPANSVKTSVRGQSSRPLSSCDWSFQDIDRLRTIRERTSSMVPRNERKIHQQIKHVLLRLTCFPSMSFLISIILSVVLASCSPSLSAFLTAFEKALGLAPFPSDFGVPYTYAR